MSCGHIDYPCCGCGDDSSFPGCPYCGSVPCELDCPTMGNYDYFDDERAVEDEHYADRFR